MTTRHSLDGVELVASLVLHDPGLVQLWWTEWLMPEIGAGVNPDQLVVIDTGETSALILVEVDESTERPPVIRERLAAYAKLFEDHRAVWHLLWVVNSPERLARLRQIAGPMKLPALGGRCWGVAIGEVSELGANAEVLAAGSSQPPRLLRELATDPKARRTSYPVGSPAWVRLLANGGREDVSGLWHGVDRNAAAPFQVATPTSEVAVAVVTERLADKPTPPLPEEPGADVSIALAAGGTVAAAEDDADLRLMHGGELVQVILGAAGAGRRAARAVELLAERNSCVYLFDELERLCRSGAPDQQLEGLAVVRNLQPPADASFRERSHALVLQLVDRGNASDVVQAALAALKEWGHQTPRTFVT